MSSEREEIRWKFQMLIDSMNNGIQLIENDRTGFLDYLEKYSHERKEIRNTLLGMIAFGIGLLVSLISIKIVEDSWVWLIIPALIGAATIYLITNFRVYYTALKINNLNSKCLLNINELIKLKGFFTGLSLREDLPKELILKLIPYSNYIGLIVIYELINYSHDIIKTPKANQELYRETFNWVKQSLDEIKEIGLEPFSYKFD